MELRQLRYLIAISKEQNINKAAKLCFVTQPALTQQIHKLEEEFNISLLIRRGRGIVLSEDGKKLTKHAKQLIKKIDEIKKEFSKTDNNINNIELGVVPTAYEYCSSTIVQKISDMNIRLRKMGDDQLEYEIQRGIINAGVTSIIPSIKNTDKKLVAREKIYLIASKSHHLSSVNSINIESIINEPLVLPQKKIMTREYLYDYFDANNLDMKIMIEVKSVDELINVIKHSDFISLIPHTLIPKGIENQICKIELTNKIYRDYYLFWNRNNQNSEKIKYLDNCFSEINVPFGLQLDLSPI